jgi:DNA repair exonuclease SbcCD nuclease subunit
MTTDFIALSDCHLRSSNPVARKDNILKTQFKKLKFIFDYADKNNCVILQAGDFLDKSRDWNLLIRLIDFLGKYPDVRLYCVLGQHDSYLYSSTKGTTLGILDRMNFINILDEKVPFGIGSFNVFGSSWEQPLPTPSHPTDNILVTHRSISDREVYPGQKYTEPKNFLIANPKYRIIVVGDIHRAFYYSEKNRFIVNTGPMLRIEATKYNLSHSPHFWHFKTEKKYNNPKIKAKRVFIPCQESHSVLSRSHLQEEVKDDFDIDVSGISALINQSIDSQGNKDIFDNLFTGSSIRPTVKRLLKEIYYNASR